MLLVVCATANRHKLEEFRQGSPNDVEVRGCPARECPETGASFEANALQKALCYSAASVGEWLFADDSGLAVDALHGAPGIHSARYAGGHGDDLANNRLLLRRLRHVPRAERTARFVCSIALLRQGRFAAFFRGEAEGLILRRLSGSQGFGYDPAFYYPPLRKSFARLTMAEKWEHSHRGKAYRAMLRWIRAHQ